MEHFRWIKNDPSRELVKDPKAKHEIAEEVADVFAFLLSFANSADIDLASALRAKMDKNAAKYPAQQFKGRY
jgi:NTP pyrophosphatase (non-canonical NTP hydrolase)